MLSFSVRHQLNTITLNLSLEMGKEIVALFGPSGAGKSITLQIIAGLVRPQAEAVCLNGRVVFDSERQINLPPQQRRVGYVMQDYTLFPHLSVAENIAYGLRRNRSKRDIKQIIIEMLDLIQLRGFENYRPNELSGGQQQRVALARAVVTEPEVLLLDEPFSALDDSTRIQLRADLLTLLQQIDIPTLLVTHDLAEASLLADRIAVIDEGKILQMGQPLEVMHHPVSVRVAGLTGPHNCFPGKVDQVTAQGLRVAVDSLHFETLPYNFEVGQRVQLCLRPDQVLLLSLNQRTDEYTNVMEGRVVSVLSDGFWYRVQLCLSKSRLMLDKDYDVTARLSRREFEALLPSEGQRWNIVFKRESIHLMPDSP